MWKWVWKANVASKVRIFWWRTIHNIIPVCHNLASRNMPISNSCPICLQAGEDIIHAIFNCRHSKEIWQTFNISPIAEHIDEVRWKEIFEGWINTDTLELAFYTGWAIWNNRKKCYHNQACNTAAAVARSAISYTTDFKEATQQNPQNPAQASTTWTAPDFGFYKLNTDASFNAANNTSKSGMVLRGHAGEIIISASANHTNIFSPLHAEINAILLSLQVICNENLRAQYVESDYVAYK